MSFVVIDRADEKFLRECFVDQLMKYQRMRSRLVRILDNYYFKEVFGDELRRCIDKAVTVVPRLNNMDELSALIAKNQNLTLPQDGFQWKIWVCPELGKDESVVVY